MSLSKKMSEDLNQNMIQTKDDSNDGKDITEEAIDCGLKQMVCSLKLMYYNINC